MNEHKETIDNLFFNINNSKDSILKDLNSSQIINYIPFWLYILRKVTSLHCIEINKDEKNPMKQYIREEIKKIITNRLFEEKIVSPDWINLISINVSDEILKPKIRDIIKMFGELSKKPNKIINENIEIKDMVFNNLKKCFDKMLTLCLDNKLEDTINNTSFDSNKMIIEFIKNPSKYIYYSIQKEMYNEMRKDLLPNYYLDNIDNYLQKNKEIIQNLDNTIKVINNDLMEKYEKIYIKESSQELERKTEDIIKLINKYNENIDKIKNKSKLSNVCNIQIITKEYEQINEINKKIKENKLKYVL
jgi:hypothetical protein